MNKMRNKYILVGVLFLILFFSFGCGVSQYEKVVGEKTIQFYSPIASFNGIGDILVFPMAWLMYFLGKTIAFNNYALVILFATIIVRSAAWPIYGQTNDMTLKMSLLAPEQAKIEKKYAGRMDKESQQRKSMEMMQLYKKYKVSFTGCLMPFIQMPIFLAFFETLRRVPFTTTSWLNSVDGFVEVGGKTITPENIAMDFDFLNTSLFGINLFEGMDNGGTWQKLGIWILAILVAGTQYLTQIISNRRQKKQKDEMNANVPTYRQPAKTEQQKSMESSMKIMLYVMPITMVIFIIQSPAALGWYWLVGNIYSALQSFISAKSSKKRLEKLKEKYSM